MSYPREPTVVPPAREKQCVAANEKVHEIIELAKTAWYCISPVTKEHNSVEYRKHPLHDRYFHFKQYDRYGIHVEVKVLTLDDTSTDITIHPYPTIAHNEVQRKHRRFVDEKKAVLYTNKSDHTTFLGEHYTTEHEGTNRYLHRGFDESVKELYDPPDPIRSSRHPGVTKLEIYLSRASTAFQGDNVDILTTLSQAFKNNAELGDSAARHAAFWRLKEIIQHRRKDHRHLNSVTARVAHRQIADTWYQYVANSSRFFRETEEGGLEEYHRDTQMASPISDPGVALEASLSHRRARMYGFNCDVLEDRF